MTRPGPSAICLECWREGTTTVTNPVGYYDVPCLRHGDRKDERVKVITEKDK